MTSRQGQDSSMSGSMTHTRSDTSISHSISFAMLMVQKTRNDIPSSRRISSQHDCRLKKHSSDFSKNLSHISDFRVSVISTWVRLSLWRTRMERSCSRSNRNTEQDSPTRGVLTISTSSATGTGRLRSKWQILDRFLEGFLYLDWRHSHSRTYVRNLLDSTFSRHCSQSVSEMSALFHTASISSSSPHASRKPYTFSAVSKSVTSE